MFRGGFSNLFPFYLALKQTLDALPSHLLTPFHGPVPPSNLLDKIARGVAEAKGPADWPHSQRATRAKIVELAQRRARENTPIAGIAEESCEDEEPREVLRPSSRVNRKRALYRQSSMDFIPDVEHSKKNNIKDNQSINRSVGRRLFPPVVAPRLTDVDFDRLSQRLQRNDRTLAPSSFHPYARPSPSPKKSTSRSQLSSLNPSTPSSSTLNSSLLSSAATKTQPGLRRSFSSLSSSSDPASLYPDNPRVQKMKRADSFVTSTSRLPKRAPSFCSNSNRSSLSDSMSVDGNEVKEVPVISEHSENQPAKGSRKRSRPMSPTTTTPAPTETPAKRPATKPSVVKSKSTKDQGDLGLGSPMVISPAIHSSPAHNTRSATKLRANVRRNPSILGGELPFPQQTPSAPHPITISPPSSRMSIGSDDARSLNLSPSTPAHKGLRRVKATFGMRPIARKISFGAISEENCEPHGTAGLGLGSAFRLR